MFMATAATPPKTPIVYPESDGKPMADNTLQADAMTTVYNNLRAMFADNPDVFVAMDLLWYPVEGNPRIRVAPDVMVALGRPKGHRGSYEQWEEGDIAPQVVFEGLPLSNRAAAMNAKRRSYAKYGVQEYYVYDPDPGNWQGWLRKGKRLVRIRQMEGWCSPLLGIVFGKGIQEYPGLHRPSGAPFITYEQLERQASAEHQRAERLAQKLRELGIDPDTLEP